MRSFGRELLIAALATVVSAQDVVHPSVAALCPAGLSGAAFVRGQSCYQFNGVAETWVQARAYCHERDGRLVSITDVDLQAWLSITAARLWPTIRGVWIGLNDRSTSGVFVWDDYGANAEHQISYSNWEIGYQRNGRFGGDCVQMRSDNGWQWRKNTCDNLFKMYIYSYICEYRAVTLNVSATTAGLLVITTAGLLVITSVAGVTLPVAMDYSSTVLPLSAFNDVTHDAGTVASKSDVALPISVSLTLVVVVVALVALTVVVWRRQQRYRPTKGSTVSGTRTDDDEGLRVGQPMYGNAPILAIDQASVNLEGGSDRVPGRLVYNICSEMSSVVHVEKNQNDSAKNYLSSDLDTDPIYAEPIMQEPSAATAAEPAMSYHQYTYIDTATLLKLQPPGKSTDEVTPSNRKLVSVSGEEFYHAQQLHGVTSTQGCYESLVSQWTPYDNVQKPDDYCALKHNFATGVTQ